MGSIEPGKRADLLVVDGDALQSPEALRDVRLVLRDGVPVGRFQVDDPLATMRQFAAAVVRPVLAGHA